MNGNSENGNFQRLLDVSERSIKAWVDAAKMLDSLIDKLEWVGQEMKDLNNLIRTKPCIMDSVTFARFESQFTNESKDRKEEHTGIIGKLMEWHKELTEWRKQCEQTEKWYRLSAAIISLVTMIVGAFVGLLIALKK